MTTKPDIKPQDEPQQDAVVSTVDKLKGREAAKKSKAYKHVEKLGGQCSTSKVQASNGTFQLTFPERLKNDKPEVYQVKLSGAVTLAANKPKTPDEKLPVGELPLLVDDGKLPEQVQARLEQLLAALVKHLKKKRSITEAYRAFYSAN